MANPSDSSSEDQVSVAILARLDKISVTLDRLLEASLDLLRRFPRTTISDLKNRRETDEKASVSYLPRSVDVSTLLDLPDHLRKPLMAIFKLGGRGTAAEVGEKIGISRPQASATLNSLVQLNLLIKKREGKEGRRGADAIFMIPEQNTTTRREKRG